MVNIKFYKKIAQSIFIIISFFIVLSFVFDKGFTNDDSLKIIPKHMYIKTQYNNDWFIFTNTIIVKGKPNSYVAVNITYNMNKITDKYHIRIFFEAQNETTSLFIPDKNKYIVFLGESGEIEAPIAIIMRSSCTIKANEINISLKYLGNDYLK